ncbi:dihydroxyacetone kinase phosphoryl donor subunit DhaM [Phytohabitans sp. ZYX-F-186]|uniref:phosphoenolpyruvate--glycerone phosphotransferase n=1 Tax=Phytohabitans maris TaxID=3071409 RepID=A0ABU0ZDU6_9ACTN|nr:dihydroxyacetone kinase phosphoryl donor subunit DhaM [Phytohabitans sp. ZYX-F-186]MDQ7904596.1 dihydroxyacetone kinase phosphoryl donor subunit DhaM [Phytohabitans sp. ZYX-F-186]
MTRFVGIVLVSHSAELAAGLRELLSQVGGASLTVEAAGGTDEGGIGTSYDLVRAAIEKADGGAGVLVLPDLGSSVLTARAVLDDIATPGVVIVDAPFVEGALAAAVIAATGADLATAVAAAEEARDVRKL